jgi:hypothetical protein
LDVLQDSRHRHDDTIFLRMPSIAYDKNSHRVCSLLIKLTQMCEISWEKKTKK